MVDGFDGGGERNSNKKSKLSGTSWAPQVMTNLGLTVKQIRIEYVLGSETEIC